MARSTEPTPDDVTRPGAADRVREWFRGGDPDGRTKIDQWFHGYSDKPDGYTFGMMGPAMVLSVLAAVLYPLTKGYGSIVCLVLALVLLLVRQSVERQVAAAATEIVEAGDHAILLGRVAAFADAGLAQMTDPKAAATAPGRLVDRDVSSRLGHRSGSDDDATKHQPAGQNAATTGRG